MSAKRRSPHEEGQANLFYRPEPTGVMKYWLWLWKAIYFLVGMLTYIGMITTTGIAFYYVVIQPDIVLAGMNGLLTLLIIYVNKVNPS